MSKLEYNDYNIESKVKTSLHDLQAKLKIIKNKAANLYVPYDFQYATYLRNLDYNIEKNISDLAKIEDWLDNTKKRLISESDDFKMRLNKIQLVKMNIKIGSIKNGD